MPVIEVSSTPIMVVNINAKRKMIHLENVGQHPIYFTKQNKNIIPNIPSADNYDFVLYPNSNQGITSIYIESIARINAIEIKGNSSNNDKKDNDDNGNGNGNGNNNDKKLNLAYFETEYITNNIC